MKCRRLKKVDNVHHLVWFGSYGKNQDGTAMFYNPNDKHDNYGDEQQGLADDLVQRLSIIQNELWYAVEYGLPLFSNITKEAELDIEVLEIINSHENVQSVLEFDSWINKHSYHARMKVQSTFGIINVEI